MKRHVELLFHLVFFSFPYFFPSDSAASTWRRLVDLSAQN